VLLKILLKFVTPLNRHQAQECFCGEPNCIGFIGGKTQTDFATMDDLYLDALGITDEADLMELKGTKKKKGKKIDDPDFMVQFSSFFTSVTIFSQPFLAAKVKGNPRERCTEGSPSYSTNLKSESSFEITNQDQDYGR